MTCGDCQTVHLPLQTLKAREAMCHHCPFRDLCRKEGCVINRWPDEAGLVHWWGTTWYGVPAPIRAALAAEWAWRSFREVLGKKYLPGCGCWQPAKDSWLWARSKLARIWRYKGTIHGSGIRDGK